ncbi:MAG: UDP-N-acetylglucosamine 1-carboxyvinyltransferase [Candidatus Latescibacteria bacterium]|nr:UDP-N-acetylglucosamine 1-carboxyvinyltransferase [Candidatus Latescibacterota bacterium]
MASLIVNGGKALSGTIVPSGNKNAVLPILCATLLTDEIVTLRNVPNITDIQKLVALFQSLGSRIDWDIKASTLRIDNAGFSGELNGHQLPQGMRSSVLLFAPLLKRLGRLSMDLSAKGCTLGVRELDPHFEVLECLGAQVTQGEPTQLTLDGNFRGGRFWQDYMSVTTTETFVMAAVLADGTSTMINAASEPHVQDLCDLLNSMGARIEGIGSSILHIEGVERLSGTEAAIASDHHEITTFLALGAITGGRVRVEQTRPQHFDLIDRAFAKLGVEIKRDGDAALVEQDRPLQVQAPFTPNILPKIEAAPWPYFPVDLLPPMVALAVRARGVMHFWNKVYEGGFTWIPELVKFGAHVVVNDPHRIIVFGDRPLRPSVVEAPYIIRAAVALYMTAATIPGQSVVQNAESIRRAHPHFVENLNKLGADVEWDD